VNARPMLLLSIAVLLLPGIALAQGASPESELRSKLFELHRKAVSILERVEESANRGTSLDLDQMMEESITLSTRVARLKDEAPAANIQGMGRGAPMNKTLLLVTQASMSLEAMLHALTYFAGTEDRAFLGFAKENNSLVWSVRKVM